MKVKEYLKIAETFFPYWDKEMANQLVKDFDLDVKKRIGKLSKGMLSMVTIIVALASKAPFTFLDEPVAGLDVVAREKFYALLIDEYTGKTGDYRWTAAGNAGGQGLAGERTSCQRI